MIQSFLKQLSQGAAMEVSDEVHAKGSSKKNPNLDKFRLRNFLDTLERHGELLYNDDRVELIDVARLLESDPRAICFRNIGARGEQLVGNVMATRKRLALAFDIPDRELLVELRRRLGNPIAPVEVAPSDAPVQEIVWQGKEVDLTRLPIHLQHTLDGAPYISSSLDFSTELETGRTNVGCRRIMPLGRAIASVDMNAPSDFRAAFLKSIEAKRSMPVAFALGSHPADFIGSQILLPASDELALIGGVRGSAVPVVRCRTIDQFVAADAEIVLEGYIDAAGYVESEGPYGEYLGYYGRLKRNPLFRISAITMRKDAIFQTVTIGGKSLATTDTAQLVALRTEAAVWTALEATIREPVAVYAAPASGGMFNVRFSMRQRYAGEVRNALAAVLACPADVKHAFAVDPDIDVFSDDQIEWALATRFQVERDLLLMTGMRAFPLDPSLDGAKLGSKAGFDLTVPFGAGDNPEFSVPDTPRFVVAKTAATVEEALTRCPQTFFELMVALGTQDGRDILRSFDDLRAKGRLKRLDDGKYALKDA
jgi:2,5-furandicarboxylate decarboxylase 1